MSGNQSVSVIIPVYNSQDTLYESLDSIRKQSYKSIELIIIDDDSKDKSLAFAKAYSEKFNSDRLKFKILKTTKNSGAGVARNLGIKEATGRYIAFLDADDLWKPHKLELQIKALQSQDAAVCYGAYELFTTDPEKPHALQKINHPLKLNKLLKSNYIGMLTGIYDTQKLGKVYMPELRKRQDWALWISCLQRAKIAIGIQEPIASYRVHTNNLSSNKLDLIRYNYAVYHEFLGYSAVKSWFKMGRFLYEQVFVKSQLKVGLPR